jgi:S1-C subfamily serine protease
MIKRFLQRSSGVLVLVGVLVAGMVIGGGAVLAFMQGNIDDLVSTVQAQGAAQGATQEAPEPGILIAGVVADSPAAEAGVVRGDILLEVNDEAVNTVLDLRTLLADLEPDEAVTLTVLHGDDERTLTATLEDREGRAYLGVILCAGPHAGTYMFRPGERLMPGVDFFADGSKTVVLTLVPDGPAAEAGIEQGDVIVAVGEQTLDADNNLATVIDSYEPGDVVAIELERDGAAESVMVTLGEHPDQADKAFLGVSYGPRIELDRQGMEGPGRFFFRALPGENIRPFELPEGANVQEGAIIHRVAEDSPAAEAGLQAGHIITAVDGEAVPGPRFLVEIIANHAPGDTLTLTIAEKERDDSGDEAGTRDVTVTLSEDPNQAGKAYLGVQLGRFFRFRQSAPGIDEEGAILEWFDQASPGLRWRSNTPELPDGLDFTLDGFSIDMLPGGLSFEGDAPLFEEGIPAIPFIDGSL